MHKPSTIVNPARHVSVDTMHNRPHIGPMSPSRSYSYRPVLGAEPPLSYAPQVGRQSSHTLPMSARLAAGQQQATNNRHTPRCSLPSAPAWVGRSRMRALLIYSSYSPPPLSRQP